MAIFSSANKRRDKLMPRILLRRLGLGDGRKFAPRQPHADALRGVGQYLRLRRIAAQRQGVQESARPFW